MKDLAKKFLKKKIIWSFLVTNIGFLVFALVLYLSVAGLLFSSLNNQAKNCSPEPTTSGSINIDSKSAKENAKAISDVISKKIEGSTPQGIAGMLGSFERESRMDPSSIERPNDPLSGHGLAQWTAERIIALMNFAESKGKKWDDLGLQLEFLLKELNGPEKAAIAALKITDVHEATVAWQDKFERAGVIAMPDRLAAADKWYNFLSSSDPIAKATGDVATSTQTGATNNRCYSDTKKSDSSVLAAAKKYIGWFHYPSPIAHNLAMIGGSAKNPDKEGYTDCSGLVWLALENAGCKVPPDMGWFTGSMTADARGAKQWLSAVSENEADAGDVVIVNLGGGAGASGHTAILAEKWHGNNTKIVQMGGNGSITNEDTFQNSFLSLLNGGDVCFARPIKK